MIRQPVLKHSIRDVPRWMTKLLTSLIRGEHEASSKAYVKIMAVKNSHASPDGRESALAYEKFFQRLADEEKNGRTSMLRGVVSMRSLVRMAVHAENAKEYNMLLAGRIIGTFEIDRLGVRGHRWQMLLDKNEAGLIETQMSGTNIPPDLIAAILTKIHDTQPLDNIQAIPSGSSMVYMWPMTRVDKGAHRVWRQEP
ncbi:hypothetical protein FGB62_35g012 [Gracilaria domingensis]|nr:hypothetical protein FGB62_35g012 [Gracilaria domingensis]